MSTSLALAVNLFLSTLKSALAKRDLFPLKFMDMQNSTANSSTNLRFIKFGSLQI